MDTVVTAILSLFSFVTGVKPQYRVHGGSAAENLALQNIQVCWCAAIQMQGTLWLISGPCRQDYAWCFRTCSRNCSLGSEGARVVCSF